MVKFEANWPLVIFAILLTLWLGFSISAIYSTSNLNQVYQSLGALQGENKMLLNQLCDYETQLGLSKGKGKRDETTKRLPQRKIERSIPPTN